MYFRNTVQITKSVTFSTTPLRSGLVPLAPVGPHELSSFISGLSWAHETNTEVLCDGGKVACV